MTSTARMIAQGLIIALFVTALAGLATPAQAQDTASCPTGFELTDDGTTCTAPAQSAPTCAAGELAPDGTSCIEAAQPITEQGPDRTRLVCPAGTDATPDGLQCISGTEAVDPIVTRTQSCPAGTTTSGTSPVACTRATTTTDTFAAAATTNYSCPDGYDQFRNVDTCIRIVTRTEPVEPNVDISTSCPLGFDRTDTGCISIETVTQSFPAAPQIISTCLPSAEFDGGCGDNGRDETIIYGCPIGFEQFGFGSSSTCTRTEKVVQEVDFTTTTTYSCPEGATPAGSGESLTCSRSVDASEIVVAQRSTSYSCPDGATLSGNSCSRIIAGTENVNPLTNIAYSCPANTVAAGSGETLSCTRDLYVAPRSVATATLVPGAALECTQGTLTVNITADTVCVLDAAAVMTPTCARGALDDSQTNCQVPTINQGSAAVNASTAAARPAVNLAAVQQPISFTG